jgi:hypothetical protein
MIILVRVLVLGKRDYFHLILFLFLIFVTWVPDNFYMYALMIYFLSNKIQNILDPLHCQFILTYSYRLTLFLYISAHIGVLILY